MALFVQNGSVALCSVLLILVMTFNDKMVVAFDTWVTPVGQAVIVFVAAVASLAAEASKIILGKDWIVVIAGKDRALLASRQSIH
jgi:iron-regulated transporter 1